MSDIRTDLSRVRIGYPDVDDAGLTLDVRYYHICGVWRVAKPRISCH